MRNLVLRGVAAACCAVAATASAADFTIDPSANWLGYMNVSELPENGGGFVFGSPWGLPDLVSSFSGSQLTLSPNTIGDPNEFWYQGVGTSPGGPGAPGNKTMEANIYQEFTDQFLGETVTFSGTVLSNTLVSPYTVVAFIKDFAPDYSSFDIVTAPLTSAGDFSISFQTLDFDFGRHVQFGFALTGPNVWVTDAPAKGSIVIAPIGGTPTFTPGDFSGDGRVDSGDLSLLLSNWGAAAPPNPTGWTGFLPTAPGIDSDELSALLSNWGAVAASTAVPEPASAALVLLALAGAARSRR